ncbi:General amino acid permease AGP2 [Colletotrichum spinosum]|uniref:General amino acid permease AGP2 n=1 Tax=Colletotrichum spinosum TaxID=1347390 RepID=A0A4V6QEL5_9PEZI|nr:General amino acid permease AGP2 [Colletotrichum spinosum]
MNIGVLPHIVNALLMISILSAGNAHVYCSFEVCVPVYCLLVSLAFACLSYLKLSSGSMTVLTWLTNPITGGTLVTYIVICVNYLFFYRAVKAQKLDRADLPHQGYLQPHETYIALVWLILVEAFYG